MQQERGRRERPQSALQSDTAHAHMLQLQETEPKLSFNSKNNN